MPRIGGPLPNDRLLFVSGATVEGVCGGCQEQPQHTRHRRQVSNTPFWAAPGFCICDHNARDLLYTLFQPPPTPVPASVTPDPLFHVPW